MMLTVKQREIYELVRAGMANNGKAPTYRQIADAAGTSLSNVYVLVSRVCARGWLLRNGRVLSVARHPLAPTTCEAFDYFAVDYQNLTRIGWPRLVDMRLA